MTEEKRKIKVLLVVCNNVLNGTERYVVDLAKNLSQDKFDVTVATPASGPLSEILKEMGIREVIYNNGKVYKYSLKGLLNLRKIINNNKYDVLHANAGVLPCVVGKFLRVKLVVETKHGIFYSADQLRMMSFLRKSYEISKQYFVDYFIAISKNDKQKLVEYFRTKESKIKVIYNGLDISNLNKDSIEEVKYSKNNLFIIGNIGRFTFQKGQEVLIEAVELLSSKSQNFQLILLGSGEKEEEFRNMVKERKLERCIIFENYKKNIFDFLASFNLLVLTSRYEGVPYVVLEAMALGVPIVTSDVGGITNVLKDGFNALITPVEDPVSTMRAIEKLISDDDLRSQIISNAKETVNKYTVERMAEETGQFYIKNLKGIN